jgi:hypothetical protein
MTAQRPPQTQSTAILRRALAADGVVSGASGIVVVLAARPLAAWLGVNSAAGLAIVGVVMLVYAASLLYAVPRERLHRGFALAAGILNSVWVAASAALLMSNWLPLTPAGKSMVMIAADVVAVFAVWQFFGLWRTRRAL